MTAQQRSNNQITSRHPWTFIQICQMNQKDECENIVKLNKII